MTAPSLPAESLLQILQARASDHPDRTAYIFLVDGEDQEERISYGELDRQARVFAASLRRMAEPGERVLLMYPSGLEFIVAYLGCLYAGVISVPIITPHPKRDVPRLKLVLSDSQATVACGRAALLDQIPAALESYPEFANLRWHAHERMDASAVSGWQPYPVKSTDLAFLQYTSGSTSAPKGVMISHANLLHNMIALQRATDLQPEDVGVMWLPPFHDMGLVTGLMAPLYAGTVSVFMAPVAFLERPYRWLRAITKYHGTQTVAPNFAYQLCTEKITPEELSQLDLSSLRLVSSAAEPVRLSTMESFRAMMEPRGFDPRSWLPAYGLAESVALASSKPLRQPPSIAFLNSDALKQGRIVITPPDAPKVQASVACGSVQPGTEIRIVDPVTCLECAPDRIGEIWLQSGSVAQGYWRKPAETEETFHARLADSGEGPFLRSGDLGFLRDGQLHITGRIKDMVIVSGRNYYPQDIELSVQQAHPAMQADGGAVFSIEDGGSERLVVVQEVKREFRKSPELPAVANAVRMAVAREHGLRADSLIFILPGRVPKTTSGKIQRHAAREAYLQGTFEPIFEWHAPRS